MAFDGDVNWRFYPQRLRAVAVGRSVPVIDRERFSACMDCGCLWSFVDGHPH